MTTDADRLDANVDYGMIIGYFVRIDIQVPPGARYPPGAGDDVAGWLGLSPDEAETFAARLTEMAHRARVAESKR